MAQLSFINFKKGLFKRLSNFSIALLFVFTQAGAALSPIIFASTASASPTKITAKSHQGQKSDLSYTSGNITQYTEGDYVNFRFELEATHGPTSGQVEVRFTGDDSTCTFFDGTFVLGAITGSGPQATVTTLGTPVAQNFGTSNGEWVQLLNIDYPTTFDHIDNSTIVNYTLRLSQEAGECNGSSQHSRLNPAGGTVEQTGAQNVPVPANQIIELPEIFVQKWVDDNADGVVDRKATAGEWSFSLDGGTPVATDASGNVTFTNVTPNGNHTVTESNGPAGQSFLSGSGTNCTFSGSTATANIQSGTTAQDATCIFNNGVRPGNIIIEKQTLPDGSQQSFNFTASYNGNGFSLSDGQTNDSGDLTAGTYSVAETVPTGWDLSNVTCSDQSAANNIQLSAGETVTCVFTNTQRGHLIVQKTTLPAADPTVFSINAAGSGTITGGGAGTITDATDKNYEVTPGTYSVSETVPDGWNKTGDTCQGVVVAPGATEYCTITNTKKATLTIIKDALPDGQNTIFEFISTGGLDPASFMLDDNDTTDTLNQQVFSVVPGDYSITETATDGWMLTDLDCDSEFTWPQESTRLELSLAAGADVTCTFTNTKLGSISGTKYEVNADSTTVGGLMNWTINLLLDGAFYSSTTTASDGSYSFLSLLPGSYTVGEQLESGWTQIYPASPGTIDVSLDAGEVSTGNDFGNFQNGSISGYKFNDLNGNGNRDDGEPKLPSWPFTFYFDADNNGIFDEAGTPFNTDGDGNFSFDDLAPGKYQICEDPQTSLGWVRTTPVTSNCRTTTIDVSGESVSGLKFGNQGRGDIKVIKNVDSDGDGNIDFQDVTDWNWNIDDAGNFATGSGNPQNVAAGDYEVSEVQKDNYHVTASSCSGETPPNSAAEKLSVSVSTGETVTCTFTNTRDTGSITVNKTLNPSDDDGLFNLQINGSTAGTGANVGDGGTTGAVSVVTGDYTIGETAGTDTDLANYSTSYVCLNGQSEVASGDATTSTSFPVSSDDNIVCTITNTRLARIIVEKQTLPDGDSQSFDFTASYNGSGFSLSDGETNDSGNLLPGDGYSVSEESLAGWDLDSATCDDQSDPSDISLQAGEIVTCTFTNVKRGSITIVKDAQPDSDQEFKFTGSLGDPDDIDGPNFTLVDDGDDDGSEQRLFSNLENGTYTVTEPNVKGWTLEDIECNTEENVNVNNRNVVIGLEPGENVTCTFVNTRDTADITVHKITLPADADETFEINLRTDDEAGSLVHNSNLKDGESDIYTVETNDYVMDEENIPSGWDLVSASCTVDENETSFDPRNGFEVNKDENIDCTFVNSQRATVEVIKYNDFNQNGVQDDNEPVMPNETWPKPWQFTLEGSEDCNEVVPLLDNISIIPDLCGNYSYFEQQETTLESGGSTTFANVKSGVAHKLTETQQEGWTLSSIDCGEGQGSLDGETFFFGAEAITPGESIECKVGNYQAPQLLLTKSNNRPEPTVNGDTVTYTLIATLPENSGALFNTVVTDLPPENFEVVAGSETASSSRAGHNVVADIGGGPAYASPGNWTIGTLLPGESVTLTYKAVIGNSVSPGTYPDLAFAQGCSDASVDCELGVAVYSNEEVAPDPFVGTQVSLLTGAVKPVNVLVNTGVEKVWIYTIIASLLMIGAFIVARGQVTQKGGRK